MRTLDSEELKLVYGGGGYKGGHKDDCRKHTDSCDDKHKGRCSDEGKHKGHKKHCGKHGGKHSSCS